MAPAKQGYKKELQEELQRAQEMVLSLETFIEEFSSFLPLAVCSVNPLGIIIDINEAFQDLAKYTAGDIVGEPIKTIFLEKEETEKIIDEISKKEVVKDRELTLISKKKKKMPVSIAGSVRKDGEGNITGYFLGIIDISEPKRLQEELEQRVQERTKELQEKVEELERIHKLTVGRELKMIELKKTLQQAQGEIKKLNEELKILKLDLQSTNNKKNH